MKPLSTADRATDRWDEPLGGITGQSGLVYERTHIEVAVAEIRFVRGGDELDEADAARIWQSLGTDEFPIFEPHKQHVVNVTITPQGAQQVTEVQQGWLLATSDRSSAVTLLPSTVVVQTQVYDRYSTSLGQRLGSVLPRFAEVTGVSRIQRLGMRYVNRLTEREANAPSFWRDHIEASFSAPLRGPLAHLVVGQHQQLQLSLDPTAGARIQTGLLEEPKSRSQYSFLVDIDVFREQTCPFEEVWCANQLRQLNRTAVALFASILSEDYRDALGPADVSIADERSML